MQTTYATTILANPLPKRRPGRRLVIGWMLSFAGFLAGATYATDFLARPALTQTVASPVVRETLIVLGLGGVMAMFGGAQALILRPYVARAAAWGAVTAVTLWVGGSLIEIAFAAGVGQTASIVVGALLFGPGCATLQYWLLRRQARRAGWWVLAWTLNWIVVFLVALGVGVTAQALFRVDFDSGLAVYYGIGGLVSGALSGTVLAGLLRNRSHKELSI
jgi:hypothetical protein